MELHRPNRRYVWQLYMPRLWSSFGLDMVARLSLTGKVTGYSAPYAFTGTGEKGWDCYGCGVNQPEGSPLYRITEVGSALDTYRCEDCCRKLGLIW